jgi:hypothetical protein
MANIINSSHKVLNTNVNTSFIYQKVLELQNKWIKNSDIDCFIQLDDKTFYYLFCAGGFPPNAPELYESFEEKAIYARNHGSNGIYLLHLKQIPMTSGDHSQDIIAQHRYF